MVLFLKMDQHTWAKGDFTDSNTYDLSGTVYDDNTFTTVREQQIERSTTVFGGSATTTTKKVGDFVTDISFQPYIPSLTIRFVATGLRPNLQHYMYFDEVNMSSNTAPAQMSTGTRPNQISTTNEPSRIHRKGSIGSNLVADKNGTITD